MTNTAANKVTYSKRAKGGYWAIVEDFAAQVTQEANHQITTSHFKWTARATVAGRYHVSFGSTRAAAMRDLIASVKHHASKADA